MSPTGAREIHDVQRAALADCRTPIPTATDAADAAFTHLARMLLNGHLTERNLLAAVHTVIVRTGYADSAMSLPLAQIWLLNEEWGQGWGQSLMASAPPPRAGSPLSRRLG
ncbi:hypothetical protein ATK30_7168 [Amycolatopsis echigonensis]|uniref:Uncharacterized protein n=1 Tax=Amycolatopsis echigonensis TaxID=2576905 RepID=A0A2N3WQS1_9PSEU|nr:hypothetical protein [Amycolatopsis niigatensis]PKV96231.1 hypothetical protein ATK30_7168 [Amycolatopsis niigatensis]